MHLRYKATPYGERYFGSSFMLERSSWGVRVVQDKIGKKFLSQNDIAQMRGSVRVLTFCTSISQADYELESKENVFLINKQHLPMGCDARCQVAGRKDDERWGWSDF